MKILITGGSGFIGQHLCRRLAAHGHDLVVLSRRPRKAAKLLPEHTRIVSSLDDVANDEAIDGIVNLAGESLFAGRWTDRRKQVLMDSRIGVTQALVGLVARLDRKPAVMVSGSAVGFYGDAGNAELTEDSAARKRDFGYLLCDAWEQSARPVSRQGVRLCLIRTGIVLGRDGGMLGKLLPVYRLGLGAMLGDGSQWLSWIHIDDMVAILVRAVETPGIDGVFNATAPAPVGPVPSSTPAQLGGRKRRRGGRKGGRKGGRRTRKAGMCGVCGAGGSRKGGRKGGRKTKRKRGGKKTHKKRKGRSGLGSVKKMVERYF